MKATSKAKQDSTFGQGNITSTNKLGMLRRWPDLTGDKPMLIADLSNEMGLPGARLPYSVSIEALQGSEQGLYSFRMQIGAKLICWLADPYDRQIFDMMQAWVSAGLMFFALRTSQGVLIRTRTISSAAPFNDPDFVMPHASDAERFMRSATDAVSSGLVKAHAKSEIDSVPKIRRLRVFVVQHAEPKETVNIAAD